jgi:hypothetical protein
MLVMNQADVRWLDALREIGKELNPDLLVKFHKDGVIIDAKKTLRQFFEDFEFGMVGFQEKFIENHNLVLLACGCIDHGKKRLHYCENHRLIEFHP